MIESGTTSQDIIRLQPPFGQLSVREDVACAQIVKVNEFPDQGMRHEPAADSIFEQVSIESAETPKELPINPRFWSDGLIPLLPQLAIVNSIRPERLQHRRYLIKLNSSAKYAPLGIAGCAF